jgi:DNA-binding MarR family transcriptional regulator
LETTHRPAQKNSADVPRKRAASTRVDVTANITYRLIVLTNSLGRSAGRAFSTTVGLTVPEWRILSVVGARGSISLAELTRILAVDKGWVSRTVVALERRELVERLPDPRNERSFFLRLTKDGVAMHTAGSRVSLDRQRRLEAALGPEEAARFYAALEQLQRVADAMEEESAGGPAR